MKYIWQAELLDYVAAKFHEEAGVFKLLIIDSIMALFRVDFSGRGELADRQQKLAQVLSRLQKVGVKSIKVYTHQSRPCCTFIIILPKVLFCI